MAFLLRSSIPRFSRSSAIFLGIGIAASAGLASADSYLVLRENGIPVVRTLATGDQDAKALEDDAAMAAALRTVLKAQLADPTEKEIAEGIENFLPAKTELDGVFVTDGAARVLLTFPEEFVATGLDDLFVDESTLLLRAWMESVPGLNSVSLLAKTPSMATHQVLPEFLPKPVQKEKPAAKDPDAGKAISPLGNAQGQPTGALTGASIFISPGHGWFYSTTNSRWETQRFNSGGNGIVEDHSNVESVMQYLLPYLWNAGARIYTVRERDMNTNQVIVDTENATLSGSWTNVSGAGYGDEYRYATTVTGTATATATFTPTIPETGYYGVYVYYRTGPGTTTTDARFTVKHTGGSTTWVQNENRDGFTWKYIGTYYFEAGTNAATGSVVVDNLSSTAGRQVIADAVRFGGGMGDVVDPDSGDTSGKPRFEESGYYYRRFMGDTSGSDNTVSAMPKYSDWECEDSWEGGANNNAVYIAWHTNAFNGTGRGTISFAYGSGGWGSTFDGVTGGLQLRDAVHDEIINDLRAGYEAGWDDDGKTTNWYGEINPSYNNDMPAALFEMAYHDNDTDAAAILDPKFRQIVARSVYQGLVEFYHTYYFDSLGNTEFNDDTLLPEPPTHLRVINNGTGGVTLSWNAPPYDTGDGLLGDAATGYKVYRSTNGYGFDNGTAVASTSTTITGLTPGQVYYFRVAATNSGGESLPTETLAARVHTPGNAPILIVNGFDRIDGSMNTRVTATFYPQYLTQRGFVDRMNTYNYTVQHAQAIDAYGRNFDSASNEAVASGAVTLTNYDTVVWILGEESSSDDNTLNASERSAVSTFLAGGGNLFISGSETGYNLDAQNVARTFYESTLKTDYVSDDAETYSVIGESGSIFDGISLTFDDGTLVYDVDYPDTLQPLGGATTVLSYTGSASTMHSSFDSLSSWQHPTYSGSSNADSSSTFEIVSSPKYAGTGAADLYYVWGSGDFIREYFNSTTPTFSTSTNLSVWVYGDNSGAQVRLCVRETADNDLFASPYVTIDFTGWRQITWNDIANNPGTLFAQIGDGVLNTTTVRLDSIQVAKGTSGASGHLYFDNLEYTPVGGATSGAAIAYSGTYKLVQMGFPFETITDAGDRNALMAAVLDFFVTPVPVECDTFTIY
ncbi:MAG: hypothetical protein PWP23_704 [Candidatus Sumerlaeota bacterium]|nr:hypothetical protein [Candidatus Sumerlaeota bacterium]